MNFEESCKTLALTHDSIFLSAFPGNIVFGEVNRTGYKEGKYFKFSFHQLFELYLGLINIIKFFVSSIDDRGVIIKLNEDLSYCWLGKKL